MSAQQSNAIDLNPNSLNLTQVASYKRQIHAPLECVWENVLDWEHLPWLHKTSFDHIELDDAGTWGWRTWSNPEHTDHVELIVADEQRYVARSYRDGNQFSEIWTTLKGNNEHTDIVVEFHFSDISANGTQKLGEAMTRLYTRLWDEDEVMMMQRQIRLHEQRTDGKQIIIGNEADIYERLAKDEPVVFQIGKREYQIRVLDQQLVTHSTICPHSLGPLLDADITSGTIQCPWHGYKFNVTTGACVAPDTAACKLPVSPKLIVSDGTLAAILD